MEDGNTTPTNPATPTAPPVAPVVPATPATQAPTIRSLDDLPKDLRDKLEAEHKRGLQTQLQEANSRLQQASILQAQVDELMGALPEGIEIGDVADNVVQTLDAMRSEKERLEAANKSAADKLKAAEELAASNLNSFHNALKNNEFALKAGPKAVSESAAKLISMHLDSISSVDPKTNEVKVTMDVADENGHVTKDAKISVEQAVALMEANVKEWGPLFKATQNGGGGAEVNGVMRTPDGGVDLKALTKDPAKFFELSKKNPELIEAAANQAIQNGY